MDITNVTQFYQLLARTGLVDQIPNGGNLMACINEYAYNCNCEKQTNRQAIYNRCNAMYVEIVGGLSVGSIALIFQAVPDMSISFSSDLNRYLRTISR